MAQISDGQVHICEVVAKIAFEPSQQREMQHEYAIYRYMRLKNVKGVATVYSLFEDTVDRPMILIMSNAGKGLITQSKEQFEVSLTEEEQEIKVAMREIHKVGIRQYDIRPKSLTVYDEGRATMIDFDTKVRARR
ncbi:hypothetical protein AX15_000465 [Amanita polypyramis BW_CC]|nr:hypothetical protein AX15_000465 [Amanita polypyramis BW_CC]